MMTLVLIAEMTRQRVKTYLRQRLSMDESTSCAKADLAY